ncbi:MAG: tyrosine-type recombinase/integrase [Alistipes sp.]|jgi:integrase/recombinase XerC|nr:tyrosine-type recombinase/integrase [Alistipes sp.]
MTDRFIAYIERERRYSPLTVRNYRHDIECFAAWWCDYYGRQEFAPAEVTAEDVRERVMQRVECLAPASVNRELSSLKSFFRYLRSRGEVSSDIFKRVSQLKKPHRLPTFVPETKMESVLEQVRHESDAGAFRQQRNALIISLLYGCGIRLAELCGVKMADVTPDGMLHVRGKGDKERIVPLQPALAKRIERYVAVLRERGFATTADAPLIVGNKGRALSRATIQRVVRDELSVADVKGRKSPHVLRHTFATHLLNRDADLREIQELMGHESLQTTQVYTHNSISRLKGTYSKAHPHG